MGATLFGGVLFGTIGLAAFVYGKRQGRLKPLVLGAALMLYSYFVPNPVAMYAIGAALTAALVLLR